MFCHNYMYTKFMDFLCMQKSSQINIYLYIMMLESSYVLVHYD